MICSRGCCMLGKPLSSNYKRGVQQTIQKTVWTVFFVIFLGAHNDNQHIKHVIKHRNSKLYEKSLSGQLALLLTLISQKNINIKLNTNNIKTVSIILHMSMCTFNYFQTQQTWQRNIIWRYIFLQSVLKGSLFILSTNL